MALKAVKPYMRDDWQIGQKRTGMWESKVSMVCCFLRIKMYVETRLCRVPGLKSSLLYCASWIMIRHRDQVVPASAITISSLAFATARLLLLQGSPNRDFNRAVSFSTSGVKSSDKCAFTSACLRIRLGTWSAVFPALASPVSRLRAIIL